MPKRRFCAAPQDDIPNFEWSAAEANSILTDSSPMNLEDREILQASRETQWVPTGMPNSEDMWLEAGMSARSEDIPLVLDACCSKNGVEFVVLALSFEDSRCLLYSDGTEVATLNTQSFDQLRDMQKSRSLMLEGLLMVRDLTKPTQADAIQRGAVTDIDINIYGYHEVSSDVASSLSLSGLFLQDPDYLAEDIAYENPQCLKLPAHHQGNRTDFRVNDVLAVSPAQDERSQSAQETVGLDYEVLLDRFARHDYLEQAKVDGRIATDLLPLGLAFLVQREALKSPSSHTLWEQQDGSDIDPTYQHVITGAKSREPQDTCGGILADDMGLGKTLMMLSAIAGSQIQAFNYAKSLTSPPGASSDPVIAAKSTLLVVPHTIRYTLNYHKYHGHSRNVDLVGLLSNDIVLTTYGTVAAEFKRKKSLLHQIKWYRIVLDEAHMIRNASTNQFRAVTALSGQIRWCLSGTPIQNSLEDLGSLVTFLRVPMLSEAAQFRRHITRQTNITKSCRQPDFESLRLLLGAVCLRRNKALLPVSRSEDLIHKIQFSWEDRIAYEQLGHAWRDALDMAVSGHKSKQAHQTVLEALLRMRIYCNNGDYLGDGSAGILSEPDELGSILQQQGGEACHLCSCDVSSFGHIEDSSSGTVTVCGHALCGDCFERYAEQLTKDRVCPVCGVQHALRIATTKVQPSYEPDNAGGFPPKLQALCVDIEHHMNESKSIVFSFWKKSLDIIGIMLTMKHIPHLRVDGALPFSQRKRVLHEFQGAGQGMVLLMTLGTGAIG
ncbi:uncharacterized protein KY384_001786 [Bacidia gigantensis]|uniref:uncharacterized protein n=1 Tax=Bacidia gigantensis TaxID=2732470 RepID=UPI001D05B5FC|nr:uncharacterized protein KY384_001786 [Bacidia gigantensis]KAG8533004.1 hypothetical protein KY384_001786 [Bacidia gigantensis]